MEEDQRQLASLAQLATRDLIKQKRKTFEKLNFYNIMDLQLKLSTSKATSTTAQDVHPVIARGIRKIPAKLIYTL